LKPANVMLGEYGETLVVDWGLARHTGKVGGAAGVGPTTPAEDDPDRTQPSPHSPGRTEAGAVVGTPQYASPEQARGDADAVGERSDVYSLGATLYHLLTGKKPIDETDVMRILERVVVGDVPAARQVNPEVPSALEAVCRKAMALEPKDRYATPTELAEEVERWLADEPVCAYHDPLGVRARRWAKRNRTLVSSAAVLLLTAVAALSVGLWAVRAEQVRTADQRDQAVANEGRAVAAEKDAKDNLAAAVANLERAEKAEKQARADEKRAVAAEKQARENLAQARKAVDDCFGIARDDRLLRAPDAMPLRRLLLEKTLPFYVSFRNQNPDDPRFASDQAEYLTRAAFITGEIGRTSDAIEHYQKARAVLLDLHRADPADLVKRFRLGAACNGLSVTLMRAGRLKEAEEAARQAVEHFHAVNEAARLDGVENLAATALGNLASLRADRGDNASAQKYFAQAEAVLDRLYEDDPLEPDHLAALGLLYNNRAMLTLNGGKFGDALAGLRDALAAFEELHEGDPFNSEYRHQLAQIHVNLGMLLSQEVGPQDEEARGHFERSQKHYRWLHDRYRHVTEYQVGLTRTQGQALMLSQTGKRGQALALYRPARERLMELVKKHPDVPQYRMELAVLCNDLGDALRHSGQWDDAFASYRQARDELARLHEANPEVENYGRLLGYARNNLGVVEMQRGRPKQAAENFEKAHEMLKALVEKEPDAALAQIGLAISKNNLALLASGVGKPKDALPLAESSRAILARVKKANPRAYQTDLFTAQAHLVEGHARIALGQTSEAAKSLTSARDVARKVAESQPAVTEARYVLGASCAYLANVELVTGKIEEGTSDAELARKTFEALLEAQPEAVVYRAGLGLAHLALATGRIGLGDPAKGKDSAEKALEIFQALHKAQPDVVEFRSLLGMARSTWGASLLQRQEPQQAEANFEEAQKTFRDLAGKHPEALDFQSHLADASLLRANALIVLREPKKAVESAVEAKKAYDLLLKAQPKNPNHRAGLAVIRHTIGVARVVQKDLDGGLEELLAARATFQELHEAGELLPPFLTVLALNGRLAGTIRLKRGKTDGAIEDFTIERDAYAALVERQPAVAAHRIQAVTRGYELGILCAQRGKLKEAAASFQIVRTHARVLNKGKDAKPEHQFMHAGACAMLASMFAADRQDEALKLVAEAVPLYQAARKGMPKNVAARQEHGAAHFLRAGLLIQKMRFAEAAPDLDEAEELLHGDREKVLLVRVLRPEVLARAGWHRRAAEVALEVAAAKGTPAAFLPALASGLAQAASGTAKDGERPLPEREKNAEVWAREAVGLLRQADEAGALTEEVVAELKKAPEFALLRKRKDFQDWLKGRKK
jgi:tetratricopeptide (TPR) repeat protein